MIWVIKDKHIGNAFFDHVPPSSALCLRAICPTPRATITTLDSRGSTEQ